VTRPIKTIERIATSAAGGARVASSHRRGFYGPVARGRGHLDRLRRVCPAQRYRPVWNALIDGFRNHAVGRWKERGAAFTLGHTLHPAQGWASILRPRAETAAAIEQENVEYLRSRL
jgi:hypothetical protein